MTKKEKEIAPGSPGAHPLSSAEQQKVEKNRLRRERGIDKDDVDRPEECGTIDGGSGSPSKTSSRPWREDRIARSLTIVSQDTSFLSDQDNTDYPGAVAIPGMSPSLSQSVGAQSTVAASTSDIVSDHSRSSVQDTVEPTIIAARLVDDIENNDRDRIRQEIYEEAEKAEVVDPKRQRRRLCLAVCCCIIVLAGIVTAIVIVMDNKNIVVTNNSYCDQATQIFMGDRIQGNVWTADVFAGGSFETCGPTYSGNIYGRWFSFVGNGSSVALSTCLNTNFDSKISVFTGGSCDSLSCLAFNDDHPACGNSAAALTLSTEVGINYYVFVHGIDVSPGSVFDLTLDTYVDDTINDSCEMALNVGAASVEKLTGSTEFASVDQVATCGRVSTNGPGLWYQVRGSGQTMMASTCDSKGTLVDTQISLFQGQCDSLQCSDGSDNSCGDQKSSVTWASELGSSYYIYVHGKDGQRGTFDLKIENIQEDDIDETCQSATQDIHQAGVAVELGEIAASLTFDDNEACKEISTGEYQCIFDVLDGVENNVDNMCQELGGRYIVKDMTYACWFGTSSFQIVYQNYPDCASFLCSEAWVDEQIKYLGEQLLPVFESAGLNCELDSISWSDGVVVR